MSHIPVNADSSKLLFAIISKVEEHYQCYAKSFTPEGGAAWTMIIENVVISIVVGDPKKANEKVFAAVGLFLVNDDPPQSITHIHDDRIDFDLNVVFTKIHELMKADGRC